MIRVGIRSMATLALVGAASAGPPRAAQPLPYRVVVAVEGGQLSGPSTFLVELERELVTALGDQGCFRSVRAGRPDSEGDDDLVVRLVVSGYQEETEFEYGIGAKQSPGFDPRGRSVARLEARFQAEVRTLADDLLLRETRYMLRAAWRPFINEDPRVEVQRELVAKAVRKTRGFACKGTPTAWSKLIRRARAPESR